MPLYVVATPLGHLGDLSPRARELLETAEVLAVEDTRAAKRLLSALDISLAGRLMLSYGEHNEIQAAPRLVQAVQAGKTVALLSEAGTPLISDPGYRLVRGCIEAGAAPIPVPGPCAAIAALCCSGLPVHAFLFRGFLPKKPGARQTIRASLSEREETLIFYETAKRLPKIWPELLQHFQPDRPACLALDLTRTRERFLRGSLAELGSWVQGQPFKGVCTLLIGGSGAQAFPENRQIS
jgi:16S rRNA (cytidine1402-2'-O)-methyltransferase